MLDSYDAHAVLEKEFVQCVGYAGKREIPDPLVRKLAEFIDAYPNDSYYAGSLLDKFYRKRTKERSIRLFDLLSSFLTKKSPLIDVFLQYPSQGGYLVRFEYHDIATIWQAIDDLGDGYDKANCIDRYAFLFTDEIASLAYQSVLAMSEPYKTRALAGIFPRVDERRKREIFEYVRDQFIGGAGEAAYRLKTIFPYMDKALRSKVVSDHLDLPDVPEGFTAYLIIRNASYFEGDDAIRLVAKARAFKCDYYRYRCLLKLAAFLPEGEVESMYEQFMEDFHTLEASPWLIHNLYHFAAVVKDAEPRHMVSLALEKIASFDDSQSEIYAQQKFGQMMFLMPLLGETHRESAFSIAETIKGGYKRTLIGRLRKHFAGSKGFCNFLYPPIFY